MRKDLIADLFGKEETYWWNVTKRESVFHLLRSLGFLKRPEEGAVAADIGCGAGYTCKMFEANYLMIGVDSSREALQFCRGRGLDRLCQTDMSQFSLPFRPQSLDLILALDVIEHLDDDTRALQECQRTLKSGGHLVVTVPAFMALWSPWDEALGHRRRYTAQQLAETVERAGFHLERLSYFFFFVFPVAVVMRQVKRMFQRDPAHYTSDFISIPNFLNYLLIGVGRAERWILTRLRWSLPVGLSVISVTTKKELPGWART